MKISSQSLSKYRADIDGLRGLAVSAVLGFHFFPELFPGGFAGVDVFFVISGFLITQILFEKVQKNGEFSLLDFYQRRILRIFPSLAVVLIVCLFAGWFVLVPEEYRMLGKHTAAGAVFGSNLLLWSETGYFDTASNLKPLLHLWSLGIEEQFYLIWPLVILVCWRRRVDLLGCIFVIATLSFVFSIRQIAVQPTAAFYLPGARFWELMLGGFLAYFAVYKESGFIKIARRFLAGRQVPTFLNAASIAGVLSIGISFFAYHSKIPFSWLLGPLAGFRYIFGYFERAQFMD